MMHLALPLISALVAQEPSPDVTLNVGQTLEGRIEPFAFSRE
jgi:hypothetical protein